MHLKCFLLVSVLSHVFCCDSSTADSYNNDKQSANETAKSRIQTLAIRRLGCRINSWLTAEAETLDLFFKSGKCKRCVASLGLAHVSDTQLFFFLLLYNFFSGIAAMSASSAWNTASGTLPGFWILDFSRRYPAALQHSLHFTFFHQKISTVRLEQKW